MSRPPIIDADFRVVFEPPPARGRNRRAEAVSHPALPFLELFFYAAILMLCQAIMRSLPPPR